MNSFINTMLVPNPRHAPSFPHSPKPLAPIQTLEQSISCIHLDPNGIISPISPTSDASSPVMGPLRDCLLNLTPPHVGSWLSSTSSLFSSSPKSASPQTRSRRWTESTASSGEPLSPRSPDAYRPFWSSPLRGYKDPPAARPQQPLGHLHEQERLIDVIYRNSRARGQLGRPQRTTKGTSSWQLRQFAEATLGSGSLRKAVKLPEGEDINEWLAVNIVDFYNQINLLYGSITEFCSPQSCPEMKATDEFEYLWQDTENFKRPTKMSAPEYVEHLMAWVQGSIDNESVFPSRIGVPFPKSFPALLRQIFKRLYRVYAHIYCHHYPVIIQLGLEPHLNTSFKHYCLFVDEHQLASGKDFWGPLGELVESMLKSD